MNDNKVLGLALAGGGAKGAYQAGVYKALEESGYRFDYVVGTSIGAVNGVMIAQHKTDEMIKLWEEATYSYLVDVNDREFEKFLNEDLSIDTLKYKVRYATDIIKNRGLDIGPMYDSLKEMVDEELVRKSSIKFGLNFIDLNNYTNCDLFIDDIPEGKLIDMITYSAMLPIFDQKFQEEKYLDGSFYRNIPHRMLKDKCDKIIIISLQKFRITPAMRKDPQLDIIEPSEKIQSLMDFNPESSKKSLRLGYYDGRRYTDGLIGQWYYIRPEKDIVIDTIFSSWIKDLEVGDNFRTEISGIYFKIKGEATSKIDEILSVIERLAAEARVDRYSIYKIKELTEIIKTSDIEIKYWEEVLINNIIELT